MQWEQIIGRWHCSADVCPADTKLNFLVSNHLTEIICWPYKINELYTTSCTCQHEKSFIYSLFFVVADSVQSEAWSCKYFTGHISYWWSGSGQNSELNTIHLNSTTILKQFNLKLNICGASTREAWRGFVNTGCTYQIYCIKSAGILFILGMLLLLRPPGLFQSHCWRKPDLDPLHQPLIVQISHLKHSAWRKLRAVLCHRPDTPPSSTHLISSALPRFGLWIKASSSTLFSIFLVKIWAKQVQQSEQKFSQKIHSCWSSSLAVVVLH